MSTDPRPEARDNERETYPSVRLGDGDEMDWISAAKRLGEQIAKDGPNGYYQFRPQQWFNWASAELDALRQQLADRENEVNTAREQMRLAIDRTNYQWKRAEAVEAKLTEANEQRITEVEHWVQRYNELEAWRISTAKLLAEAETEREKFKQLWLDEIKDCDEAVARAETAEAERERLKDNREAWTILATDAQNRFMALTTALSALETKYIAQSSGTAREIVKDIRALLAAHPEQL